MDMQLRHLDQLKKEMNGIETIGAITNYRRRSVKQQDNMNYKIDHDQVIGDLSQIHVRYSVRHKIEQRKKTKQTHQDSQLAMYIVLS